MDDVHPLQELEQFYLGIRAQVDAGTMPPQDGMRAVAERSATDAVGVVWRVDIRTSTPSAASFLCAPPGGQPVAASREQFALQAAPAGFQLGGAQAPGAAANTADQDAGDAAPEKVKKAKKAKQDRPAKKNTSTRSNSLSGLAGKIGNITWSPRTITAAVAIFVAVVLILLFLRSGGDSTDIVSDETTTTDVADGTETTLAPDLGDVTTPTPLPAEQPVEIVTNPTETTTTTAPADTTPQEPTATTEAPAETTVVETTIAPTTTAAATPPRRPGG